MQHTILYYSTLDVDTNDYRVVDRMVYKVSKCPFIEDMILTESSSKGFHFKLLCRVQCDICRICYDDFRRFAYDQKRDNIFRNILFKAKISLKEFIKDVK